MSPIKPLSARFLLIVASLTLLIVPSCKTDDDTMGECEAGTPFFFSWEMPATLPYDLWVFLSTEDGEIKASAKAQPGQYVSLEAEQCEQERLDLNVLKVFDLGSQKLFISDTYTHLENGLLIELPSFSPPFSTDLIITGISTLEKVDWPNWLTPGVEVEHDPGQQELLLSGYAYPDQPFFVHIRANGEADGRYFYADRGSNIPQTFTVDYSDLSPATVKHTLDMGGLIDPKIFIAGVTEPGSDRFVPLLHTIDSTNIGLIDVYWPDEADFSEFIFYYDEYLENYRREKRLTQLPVGVDPWPLAMFTFFGDAGGFQLNTTIPQADLLRFGTTVELAGGVGDRRIQRQIVVPASQQGAFYRFPPYPDEILNQYPALANFAFEPGSLNEKKSVEVFEELDDYGTILSNYLAPIPFWRAAYQFEERTY